MVIYGYCVNNVLINSEKFSKFLDFETFLWKSCSLNSESKSQVICGCERFSLGRTASFSVKILFNRQIFRTTQFCSRGDCCIRLTSACCAYFEIRTVFLGHARRKCRPRPRRLAETGTFTVHHFSDNKRIIIPFTAAKFYIWKGAKLAVRRQGSTFNNHSSTYLFVDLEYANCNTIVFPTICYLGIFSFEFQCDYIVGQTLG